MNRIEELRRENNMRQADLAAILNVKPQSVSRYERGDHNIDMDTICRLCDIFGCTADYLLCRSDVPTEATPANYQTVSADEAELLRRYNALNEAGREQLIKYTDYLMSCPEYRPGDNTVQVG